MSEELTYKREIQDQRNYTEEDEIDLTELFQTIKKGWKTLIFVTLLSFSGALYHLSVTENIYRADAHLLPLGGRSNMEMKLSDFSEMEFFKDILKASMPTVFSSPTTTKIRSTILSKNFLIFFIEKHKLMPRLFPSEYDFENNTWLMEKSCIDIEDSEFEKITGISLFKEACHPTIMQGAKKLHEMIYIGKSDHFVEDNNLIQIAVESEDPRYANMLLLKIIQEADHRLRENAIKLAAENQEYLSAMLSKTNNEKIKSRLQTVVNSQLEQIMYAQTNARFLFEVLDPPIVPEEPIKPKRKLILVVSLITGFILGVFMVFLINFFRENNSQIDA